MTLLPGARRDMTSWPASNRALVVAWLTGHSAPTQAAYWRDLQHFMRWASVVGITDLLSVTRQVADQYAADLQAEGRAPATIARRLSALAGLYARAVDEELLPRSPLVRVRRPQTSEDSPRLGLDRDEARGFLRTAQAAGERDHLLVCLLLLNGLRVSEATAADVEDLAVERGHRVLSLVRKGGRHSLVPLAPRTAAALDAYLAGRSSGPLLHDAAGARLDRFDAVRIVRRLATRAGLAKRISPHSLRHSFVTAALDANVPLRDVQDAAGHRDPRTTRRYDRGRHSLDRHATYAVATFLAPD